MKVLGVGQARTTGIRREVVTDLEATRAFYAAAFGWQFNDYGPSYAGIRGPDGEEVGGLNATNLSALDATDESEG